MRDPLLFASLPPVVATLFLIALVITVVSIVWAIAHFVASAKALRRAPDPDPTAADDHLWVVLVPALNEEVTIADSVARLRDLRARNRLIIVIDDGSDDRTAEILAAMPDEDLRVLRRELPDARLGKAAALNAAYRLLDEQVLTGSGRFAGWDRDRVVIVVVDADGRLAPDSPAYVAAHLADPRVGGVQLAVRIYNRARPVAMFQHLEFGTYGHLHQMGRTASGAAGMGGNGQFNRLSALDDVVGAAHGPWRDTLTEDQDLGLRLIGAGWRGEQEMRVAVEQQGLNSVRRLVRQRTRWAQGNLQAMQHLGVARTPGLSFAARLEIVGLLVVPLTSLIIGVSTVTAGLLWLFADVTLLPSGVWWLAVLVFLGLALLPVALGILAQTRGEPLGRRVLSLVVTIPYALYVWLGWVALVRAAGRQLVGATKWAKTERESIGGQPDGTPGEAPLAEPTGPDEPVRGQLVGV